MSYFDELERYLDAMAELWPRLSADERQAKLSWERSEAFTRDREWPGWVKYLGPPPPLPEGARMRRSA